MTAFSATYSDFRLVKGRKVVQFVFEVPLEQADAALEILGGVPKIGEETWVGVAPLKLSVARSSEAERAAHNGEVAGSTPAGPTKQRTPWHELRPSTQAALACRDVAFQKWLGVKDDDPIKKEESAAWAVRSMCGVKSRSELDNSTEAARRWSSHYLRFISETGRMAEPR